MLHGYCSILDSSRDHINAQPHAKMNEMRKRLDENCEYVGYELSYRKFKAQVNVFFKNKRDVLKLFIESNASRPYDCPIEHWEGLKHLIASSKQGEIAKNHVMCLLVTIASHYGHGRKVDVVRRLVSSKY
jgi:hypothetical protein